MTMSNAAFGLSIALGVLLPSFAVAAPPQDGPRSTSLTAAFSPPDPIVGVTKVTIAGTASAKAKVIDTSTFPDGSVHRFAATADASGAYRDGPFVLRQLGTYRDVLRDEATGAQTTLSYSGLGDFTVAVDPASATILAGAEAIFTLTFKSVSGFGGEVVPLAPESSEIPGAAISWSTSTVRVPPNGSASVRLTILTLLSTPPRPYTVTLEGKSGSVIHAVAPAVALTVAGPKPGTITAAMSPDNPIVGVTKVTIRGSATAGGGVTDITTFPDGSTHRFYTTATGAGTYADGPFVLRQLGTYHDILRDDSTGATAKISYQGAGDFSTSVETASRTVARGQEATFLVTFKSQAGFGGTIRPAAPNSSKIPGATAAWSAPVVTLRPGESGDSRLSIQTSADTPPGIYEITVQGTNGSRTHAAGIHLTVR
jgi:hypothetical protein